MKEVYLSQFIEKMNFLLKEKSFIKKNLNWVKDAGEVYLIINIQKSQWSKKIYLNWGIFIKQLIKHVPSSSIGSHLGGRLDYLVDSKILDFENEIPMEKRFEELEKLIKSNPYDLFGIQGTKNELVNLIHNSGILSVVILAQEYLGLSSDFNR
jgi:hypothetical protein